MKINKTQALYKALPHCWTTYSDSSKSDYKYACEVIAWNTQKVAGINEDNIRADISRRIQSFEIAGGKVTDEFSPEAVEQLEFIEPAMIEDISDIVCKINPNTYYCQQCSTVVYRPRATFAPTCPKCHNRKMNQLQMVYACECGFAEGVKATYKEPVFYHAKDKENQFKFFTQNGQKREMSMLCPVCNKVLLPKNATDSRLFYAQSGSKVNLFNEEYSLVLKTYKENAELLMLGKWFELIDNEGFSRILKDPKAFFEKASRSENDPDIIALAKALNKPPREIVALLDQNQTDLNTIDGLKGKINSVLPLERIEIDLPMITAELMEYDTLKYPKSLISLTEAVQKGINLERIIDSADVYQLLQRMGIEDIQVSEAVQIIKYAYGYTRLRSCPDGSESTTSLRLRGFKNKVFTTILETEGLLVEISMLKIYRWLVENRIVSDDETVEDELQAKRWFLENIHLNTITHFSTIPGTDGNIVTKVVYSLLHTISHMMIISAGKNSGLGRDSISELLFPCAAAFFIFPTTSEGVTLGSVSGMFETELESFLNDTYKENEVCTFDPICKQTQNGACVACTYLSEVNCTHFNKDLSRAYLYGGTIKINNEEIRIKKGFWVQ